MSDAGGGDRSFRVAGALVFIVLVGVAAFVPTARVVLGALFVAAGPVTIYGGLVAFLRGSLGMHSATHLIAGLACGALTPMLLLSGLIVGDTAGTVIALAGAGCSLLAIFFAVAAFDRERTPTGRYVPPVDG